MNRITCIILFYILTSCHTTRQATTYAKVDAGSDLEKVELMSLDRFFNHWVYNRKIQKIDLNVRELHKDNQFTYFGKPTLGIANTKWTFFKVQTDTLTHLFPNYKDFYGEELHDYAWANVIPKEDLALWSANRTIRQNEIKPSCPLKKNKPLTHYSLVNQKVILTITWHIACEELEGLKNKTYKASYNLLTKEYAHTSPDNQ